jgi:Flp pilus assembly pilin Flp
LARARRTVLISIGACVQQEVKMREAIRRLWSDEQGQDIAEYAVMLAVILVIVVGTVRLIGSNANTVFSQVASSIQ